MKAMRTELTLFLDPSVRASGCRSRFVHLKRARIADSDRHVSVRSVAQHAQEAQDGVIRAKRCVACGERFPCHAGDCWCETVSLTAETQARLLAQYTDCLCPPCLRQQASSDVR